MRTFYLAAVLMAALVAGCLSPGEFKGGAESDTAKLSTSVADAVLAKLGPFSTEAGRQAAVVAVDEILAKRRAEGRDENSPLNVEEWAAIGFAILTAILGLDKARNAKYVKAGKPKLST